MIREVWLDGILSMPWAEMVWSGYVLMELRIFVGAEESEELLKQYVQDSLILKSSGGGSKLYDQYVVM